MVGVFGIFEPYMANLKANEVKETKLLFLVSQTTARCFFFCCRIVMIMLEVLKASLLLLLKCSLSILTAQCISV